MLMRLLRRELQITFRKGAEVLTPLWFFLLVITLFPLSLGPERELLSKIAPAVIWVAMLLASLLALDRLFKDDFIDGSLEQLMLLPLPLAWVVLIKVFAHWLTSALPLLLLSPLAALLLSIDFTTWGILALTLLLGSLSLSFIGAIGAALTVGLNKGGALLSLLILPLSMPILMFALGTINAANMGASIHGYLAILLAMMTASITFAPLAIAASLKVSMG